MHVSERRYLPLLTENGEVIARPDYMVLAALAHIDLDDMHQTYGVMLKEAEQRPDADAKAMTETAQMIRSKIIQSKQANRVLAGEVVLELARIAQATGEPPSVNKARRLVVFNHHRLIGRNAEDSVQRRVEKAFSAYRDISHLLAVAVYDPELLHALEGEEQPLLTFLGLARAFKRFIDDNVVSSSFQWNPFRVPEQFPPVWTVTLAPLTDQELRIIARQ